MTLSIYEQDSGGQIRDQDARQVTAGATFQGKPAQFVSINVSVGGQTQLVAAPGAGLAIKVVQYVIIAAGAVTVKFQSGNADLTGPMALAQNGGCVVLGEPSAHLFQTAVNTALNINLGGAVQVSGHLAYFVE
jgi:hypothetical protein